MIYNFFETAKEANVYEIKSRRLCSQKVVTGIKIDDTGNLEDLLRVVFIDEECGNLKVVNDGGELTRNIKQKKKSDFLRCLYIYTLANDAGGSISSQQASGILLSVM